jgi:aminoglycoside phosphotransferase (APT) family kinase protein
MTASISLDRVTTGTVIMDAATDRQLASTIAAIVERHKLSVHTWTRLASLGSATTIYLLDDTYVLRVPHDQPEAIAAIRTDPIVIPAARRAGVRTPALIAFDDRCDLLPVPYGVYERVPGEPLDRLALPRDATPQLWRELGRDLALLHRGVSMDGVVGTLRINDETIDPLPWLHAIDASGLVPPSSSARLRHWLERLAPFAQLPATPRFCHGDVNAGNILVDAPTRQYRALVDWGGVFWGDATWDFAPVSLLAVPPMLAGYRAICALDNDATAEARILWHHVVFTIFGVWKGQQRGPDWAGARVTHLQRNVDIFLTASTAHWLAEAIA